MFEGQISMGRLVSAPCALIAVLFFNCFISIYYLYIILDFVVTFACMYVIHFYQVRSPHCFLVIPIHLLVDSFLFPTSPSPAFMLFIFNDFDCWC